MYIDCDKFYPILNPNYDHQRVNIRSKDYLIGIVKDLAWYGDGKWSGVICPTNKKFSEYLNDLDLFFENNSIIPHYDVTKLVTSDERISYFKIYPYKRNLL